MHQSMTSDRDYSLWMLVAQTRDAMVKARQKELHPYNIHPRQAGVLFVIQATGSEVTPAEISRQLFRESQSVSEILSRMEKKGLVRRVQNLERRNSVRIVLTEKGREAYHQSMKRQSIYKTMSVLSEEERQQLRSCLLKLRDKALKECGIVDEIPLSP